MVEIEGERAEGLQRSRVLDVERKGKHRGKGEMET